MSRSRRLSPAHRSSAILADAEDVGTIVAWCPGAALLPEARRLTHDVLVRAMGDARSGPVCWIWKRGPAALDLIDVMASDAEAPETLKHYETCRQHIIRDGGYVVVALAAGTPPS